jgi:ADP-ribosyl-[dinitrogen reductase] hydrolase
MRCCPIALIHLDSIPMLIEDSRRSARITHADPKAQSSCVLLNYWIAQAILNCRRDAREEALQVLASAEREAWKKLQYIECLPESEISSSGYTVHTVEAAAWSFLTTTSFEDAVVRAANLGDDADTVAAVTGALAGAYYGLSAIPSRWINGLMDFNLISETARKLAVRKAVD